MDGRSACMENTRVYIMEYLFDRSDELGSGVWQMGNGIPDGWDVRLVKIM